MNYKKSVSNKVFSYCNDYCFGCFGNLWPFKRKSVSDLEIPILDTAQTRKLYHTSQSVHEDEIDQCEYQPPGWDDERTDKQKNLDNYGRLTFSTKLEGDVFWIKIIEVENLSTRVDGTLPNPFVRVRIGNSMEYKMTKVAPKSTSAKWNRELQFQLSSEDRETKKLEITILDKIQDHLRLSDAENILGTTRIKFQNINLRSLKHDMVLIPREENTSNDKLNIGKASLLNSKIGRNECRIYRASLVDFEKQETKALTDIENLEEKKDAINKEIIEVVNKIKGLNWKDTDIKQEGILKNTEDKIKEIEEEIARYEKYIEGMEKEEAARNTCQFGAVHVGLEYRKISEEVVVYLYSASELVADDGSSADPYAELQVTRPNKNKKDFTVDTHKLEGDVKGNLNPNWCEAKFCIENVEKGELNNTSVEIHIKDHKMLGRDESLGYVRLGSGHLHDSGHWEQMTQTKGLVKMWHCLKKI